MGCVQNTNALTRQKPSKCLKIGLLTIKISKTDFKCLKFAQGQFQKLFMKIWMTNQVYEFPLSEFTKSLYGNQLTFVVNSCHLHYGRFLNIQISNPLNPQEQTTAFGVADLDEIIESSTQTTQQIHLNYLNTRGCMIEYIALFEQFPSQKFKAHISYPNLIPEKKLKNKLKGKFIIGEQHFEFEMMHPQKIEKGEKSTQKDYYQSCSFLIPICLTMANLELFEEFNNKKNIVGSVVIGLHKILSANRDIVRIEESITVSGKIIGSIIIKLSRICDITLPIIQTVNQQQIFPTIKTLKSQKYLDPDTQITSTMENLPKPSQYLQYQASSKLKKLQNKENKESRISRQKQRKQPLQIILKTQN